MNDVIYLFWNTIYPLAQNQKVPSIYPFYRKLEPFDSKLHFELEPFDSKPAGKLYFKTNKLRHS